MSRFSLAALALLVLATHSPGQDVAQPADNDGYANRFYTLNELGDDPALANWAVQALKELYANSTGPGQIQYFAPRKLMVVYQRPAVQTQVEAFLKDLKKTLPAAKERPTASASAVVPAGGPTPNLFKADDAPTPGALSYPVAPPARQPKHLFHFIIRYEGEGVVDSSVVALSKVLGGGGANYDKSSAYAASPPYSASPSLSPAGGPGPAYATGPGMVPLTNALSPPTARGTPVMPPADSPATPAASTNGPLMPPADPPAASPQTYKNN